MKFELIFLVLCISNLNAKTFKLFENNPNNVNEILDLVRQRGILPDWMKIYPGTKWCGDGDIASHYNDLGEEFETDICCRDHDHCEDIIHGGETKYGLLNDAFYTKLVCDCDIQFRNCLKEANTSTSRSVGTLFFTLIKTQCFKEEYPVSKCLKYSYFPWKKCIEYEIDDTKSKMHQWFDLPNF